MNFTILKILTIISQRRDNMTTINSEIYQAFLAANVPEEQARAAAEAVSKDNQLKSEIKDDIHAVRDDLKNDISCIETNISRIETNITWLRWLMITGFTLTLAGFSVIGNMILKLTEMVAKAHGLG